MRSYTLPDLFAGKMHAVLCRAWQNRVKGRDWYDLVWYVTHHPMLYLPYLEERMRQSGHWQGGRLTSNAFRAHYAEKVANLDIDQARREVAPFVKNPVALEVWSREFFLSLVERIGIQTEDLRLETTDHRPRTTDPRPESGVPSPNIPLLIFH